MLSACSLASQQKSIKQKMAGSKATLQKRFDELKRESTGTGRARSLFNINMDHMAISLADCLLSLC